MNTRNPDLKSLLKWVKSGSLIHFRHHNSVKLGEGTITAISSLSLRVHNRKFSPKTNKAFSNPCGEALPHSHSARSKAAQHVIVKWNLYLAPDKREQK